MTTPEHKVKDKIKRALKSLPMQYQMWPVQSGLGAATVDCLCCVNGHFIGIEAKAAGKHPTPRQYVILEKILEAGGMTFVIDGDESLRTAMESIRLLCL